MRISRLVLLSFWQLLIFTACEKDSHTKEWDNHAVDLSYDKVEASEGFMKSKLQNRVLNCEALQGEFCRESLYKKAANLYPAGYKKNGEHAYPVVYLLHGEPFSEKAFIDIQLFIDFIAPHPIWIQL